MATVYGETVLVSERITKPDFGPTETTRVYMGPSAQEPPAMYSRYETNEVEGLIETTISTLSDVPTDKRESHELITQTESIQRANVNLHKMVNGVLITHWDVTCRVTYRAKAVRSVYWTTALAAPQGTLPAGAAVEAILSTEVRATAVQPPDAKETLTYYTSSHPFNTVQPVWGGKIISASAEQQGNTNIVRNEVTAAIGMTNANA